jgi:metal-responsive CopG/Arc/MetJ family transcriptional regulator
LLVADLEKRVMGSDRVTIKIPRQLYNKLRKIIDESGFSSVNEFIVYVLRDLVALQREREDSLTPKEVKLLKERLKKLGYL